MAMQHYANFLRARRQYDKALQCLEYGIELCENLKFYVDAVYYVNFQLQLTVTRKEMSEGNNAKVNWPTHSKPRRALEFNISPENNNKNKEKLIQNVMASGKKPAATMRPLPNVISGSGCSSSKKSKTLPVVCFSGSISSSGSSSSLDIKLKQKPLHKFEICEDSTEIVKVVENIAKDAIVVDNSAKSIKRTKNLEENEQQRKTPKVIRNTSKSSKTTVTKSSTKIKNTEIIPKYHIDIDLTDTPESSPKKSSTSSSLENLDAKENLNTNEIVAQMQNLEIKVVKRTKPSIATTPTENETKPTRSRGRKPNLVKESTGPVVIVLEDSPCTIKPNLKEFIDKPKTSRNRATTKDKSPNVLSNNNDGIVLISPETRPRRQRKLVLENNEKPNLHTTPSITRRRQKNLV